jgi:hypothetical protein
MTNIHLSEQDLHDHLDDNVQFLKKSCESFDSGFHAEAKRLAVIIRVLVHDTSNSTSLLKQLDYKDNMGFYNTASKYNPDNLAEHVGLTCYKFQSKGSRHFAPLDMTKEMPSRLNNYVNFNEWWKSIVIKDGEGVKYSREDLVKILANKEGAHVDPKISKDFMELRKDVEGSRLGWVQIQNTNTGDLKSGISEVDFHSVRQIAYELIKSIEKKLNIDR